MSEPLLSFTKAAVKHIQHIMASKPNAIGFRLAVKQTGCSGYMYVPEIISSVKEGDIHLEIAEGLPVYIDPNAKSLIQGTYVDYVQKALGQYALEFDNPNAEGLCGCGESFKLKNENVE